jgi:hypothetical protein
LITFAGFKVADASGTAFNSAADAIPSDRRGYALSNAGAARGVEDLALEAAGRDAASTTHLLPRRTRGARAAGAVAATALTVLLALLPGGLAAVVG